MQTSAGRLWIVLAAVLWSSGGLFAKAPLFDTWPPETRGIALGFWRALFAGLVLLPLVRRPSWKLAMLPMVLCFTGMNAAFLTTAMLTTAANAIWLQSTAPLWVFLAGVTVLREPASGWDWLALACGLAGIGWILRDLHQTGTAAGIACGLTAGLLYGGVVLCMRSLRGEDTAWLVALNHLVAAGLLFPVVAACGLWPDGVQLPVLAAYGAVQMALPYFLFARGLRNVPGPEATLLGLLEPLLVPLWAILARGASEVPAPATLCGAGLILAGLVVRFARLPRRAPPLGPGV